MNYQLIVFVFTVCLLPVFPVKNASADTIGNGTSLRRTFIPPRALREHQKSSSVRPNASVLEENGYFYNYKGKPVKLLRIKDRVTLSYKENNQKKPQQFKQKQRFKSAAYHHYKMGHKTFELMTVDRKTIENKSAQETFDEIVTGIKDDPSVLFAAPVYYEPLSGEEIIITDRVAVKVTDEKSNSLRETIASTIDAEFEKVLMPQVLIFKCNNINNRDALQRCMAIEQNPDVIWAQPEMVTNIEKYYVPNDPLYNKQWYHQNTGAGGGVPGADMKVTSAWDIQQMGDTNITIAILDEGIDITHPDLSIATGGHDFCGKDDDPSPSSILDNHGTAVAGVAAAIGNNGIGVAGVAAGAKILPIKMLDDSSNLSNKEIAAAIIFAYEHGADIINNSWGNMFPDNVIMEAIINASTLGRDGKGCLVFCSSGNSATSFTTHSIPFSGTSHCYVSIVYQKDDTGSAGDDNIAIDNVFILGSDGNSVVFSETFSGPALPAGWGTSAGNNGSLTPVASIPGWSRSTTLYEQGFGDQASFCSGAITNNQWTELRLPFRTYQPGERLTFNVRTSTEEGHDLMIIRYYNNLGHFAYEDTISSGIHKSTESAIAFPAGLDSSIAVGASTDLDFRSDYSQYDVSGTEKTVDFVAPSGGGIHGIPTTDRTGAEGYSVTDYFEKFSGTSSSCPAASGLAALILSRNPHLSRNKVLEVMRSSCDKIGGVTYIGGVHKEYGHGRLNARRALENLPPSITGQDSLAVFMNGSTTLTTDDLVIFDTETPDGPFTLTVSGGSHYSVSGTTITAGIGYVGTLSVPVTINDGTFTSDIYHLSIAVRATNVAPVISGQSPLTMLEDGKLRIVAGDLTITDSDDPSGPFTISLGTGTNYTIVDDTIFPVANFNGTLTIPVTASDMLDTSAPFNVTVTVTPVNDSPTFTVSNNVIVDEDCGPYSGTNWATGISAGPFESGQILSFTVTTTNSTLFAIAPTVSPSGTLSFTPASNKSGTATITVTLYDNGNTTNGGSNASTAKTFTITVTPVNDPPVFTKGPNVIVSEDAGAQTIPLWASTISAGAIDETGQNLHFTLSTNNNALFAVLPSIAENGTLTFTALADKFGSALITVRLHDNGGGHDSSAAETFTLSVIPVNDPPTFTAGSSITVNEDAGPQTVTSWASAISAGPYESDPLHFIFTISNADLFSSFPAITANGDLKFTTAANASGVATVTARLYDATDSSSQASFTITALSVNDPPLFVAGPVVSVLEDASVQILPGWATITSGASDEALQTVGLSLSISDTTLFLVKPSITDDGTLSFTPAKNRYGSAEVTVTLTDNGGTTNGGVATATAVPFTITIIPVNDAPQFNLGIGVTVLEDGGGQSYENWASDISAGPSENAQTLSFSVMTANTALFSLQPAINASGKLTFTTAPNAFGAVEVKVILLDNGGVEHGGINSSTEKTFTINISPVNDAPKIVISGNQNLVPGAETIITISATDVDGQIPVISVQNLPSFAVFSTVAGSGTATITCQPVADTGTFFMKIIADDNLIQLDTTLTLRVVDIPTGAILVRGVTSQAITRLYATVGWTGKPVLTGPGTITNVKAGSYLLSVSDSGARTEYYYSVVASGTVDTVTVVSSPHFPLMFAKSDTLRTVSGLINAGGPVSVVIDDIDSDGKNDIAYVGADGVVRFCKWNGASFADPVPIHSGHTGKNVLRCVDWNEDGINDLLVANIDGFVRLSKGKADGLFADDSILFTTDPGCTGMELVAHQKTGKGMYLGFSNGTMQYVVFASDGTRTTITVRDKIGQAVDVIGDANGIVLDITGDGLNELIIGNRGGFVQAFTLKSVDTVSMLGMVATGGMPLGLHSGVMLSSTVDSSIALPAIVYADGNGTLYRSNAVMRGDITGDGTVDILDLQQLGIHWGQRTGDAGWVGATNLSVSTGLSDVQVINVLDLQVLGNFWGMRK